MHDEHSRETERLAIRLNSRFRFSIVGDQILLRAPRSPCFEVRDVGKPASKLFIKGISCKVHAREETRQRGRGKETFAFRSRVLSKFLILSEFASRPTRIAKRSVILLWL